jgi:hypothetical protein
MHWEIKTEVFEKDVGRTKTGESLIIPGLKMGGRSFGLHVEDYVPRGSTIVRGVAMVTRIALALLLGDPDDIAPA